MNLKDLIKKHEEKGNKDFPKVTWFSLRDNGDNAIVRFLDTDIDTFDVYECHEIEIDGFKTKVKCLGDGCPLCQLGQPRLRGFFQMTVNGEHKIWERGIADIKNFITFAEEDGGNLSKREYKVIRNGAKGSTKTTYTLMPKAELSEAPAQKVKVLGFYVRELTKEQMLLAMEGKLSLKKDNNQNNNVQSNTNFDNLADMSDLEPIDDGDMPF